MKKRIILWIVALLLLLTAFGCARPQPGETAAQPVQGALPSEQPTPNEEAEPSAALPETRTDRSGATYDVIPNAQKIISLAPSNTEILIGLGYADALVAVDTNSYDVVGLPANLPMLDMMSPDAESIVALEPDIVFSSDINMISGAEVFQPLTDAGIQVVYVPNAISIDDIVQDITFIAALLSNEAEGEALAANMLKEIDAVVQKVKDAALESPTVYFEISPAPYMYSTGSGTYLQDIFDRLNITNIFADQDGYFSPSAEEIVTLNPQIILTNCTYTEDPSGELLGRTGFESIDAIQNEQVFVIDANPSSRQSQHVSDAVQQIAKAVYPVLFK